MNKPKSLNQVLRAWMQVNHLRSIKIQFDHKTNKFNAIGLEPQARGGSKIIAMAGAVTPDAAVRDMVKSVT